MRRGAPTAGIFGSTRDYTRALEAMAAEGIHPSQRALILAHLDAPDHTASWRELAPAARYPNAEAVKLHYGRLAHRVADKLGVSFRQARDFWLYVLVDWAGERDKGRPVER